MILRVPAALGLSALAVLVALAAPAPARARITILPDSTVHDVWQLANGLKVVAHHVSTSHHVAMTLAWPTGSDADPAGQAGHACLLAELEFLGAAGDVPARTRAEMATIRPAGWGLAAGARVTQLSEVATRPQFPGAMHQLAARLRGVTLTPASVKVALDDLRGDLDAIRKPTSNADLYAAVREVALGRYDPRAAEEGLRALARLTPEALQEEVRRTFVPAGAVLSLAGNLGDMDLHALIENEFGSIPAGTRLPPLPQPHLAAASRRVVRAGLNHGVGALGIVAPALDDSTHPSFYFAVLVFASYALNSWGSPKAPLQTRFQYSLFDDPDLVRFYPPVESGVSGDSALDLAFDDAVRRLGAMAIPSDTEEPILRGIVWLLGGSMPPEVLGRAARDPSVLATVASNQAVRELWGGEPFWSEYRERLLHNRRAYDTWIRYLISPRHRVKLVLAPAPGAGKR